MSAILGPSSLGYEAQFGGGSFLYSGAPSVLEGGAIGAAPSSIASTLTAPLSGGGMAIAGGLAALPDLIRGDYVGAAGAGIGAAVGGAFLGPLGAVAGGFIGRGIAKGVKKLFGRKRKKRRNACQNQQCQVQQAYQAGLQRGYQAGFQQAQQSMWQQQMASQYQALQQQNYALQQALASRPQFAGPTIINNNFNVGPQFYNQPRFGFGFSYGSSGFGTSFSMAGYL